MTWWADAVCSQTDPEAFFPKKGGSVAAAKATCATCPVIAQCAEHALTNEADYGVWGGLSPRERARIRRRRGLLSIHERGLVEARETAFRLAARGMSSIEIGRIVDRNESIVNRWLKGAA